VSGHKLHPVSWAELVRILREMDFDGPFQGGKHPYMIRGDLVLTLPNPHRTVIGVDLIQKILRQAGISREEWFEHW
jgi:predicted RNA binding protein YcfA (HicA-like mRNA interferase family)